MKTAIYRCLGCHALATGTHAAPDEWQWDQRQVPRLLCPACGCACVPEGWRLVAFDVAAQRAAQGMHIEALAHAQWSGCRTHWCASLRDSTRVTVSRPKL